MSKEYQVQPERPKGYKGMHRERRDFEAAAELAAIEAAEKVERDRVLRQRMEENR